MSSAIDISDLSKRYNSSGSGTGRAGQAPATIFDGLSMHVQAGELVALVGPSGCGKSTLLNLVAGLEAPTRGEIRFDRAAVEVDVVLSMVFQQPRLIDWLSVAKNIAIVFEREGVQPAVGKEKALALLQKVGLRDHAASYPQILSGGQKQRVAIARAFAIRPDILLLDEPFSALDELTARRLRLLLQDLWQEEEQHRPTGILVTHNMLEAALLADRIYVMDGKPSKFAAIIDVDLPRPRDPDDPALFDVHRRIMRALGVGSHAVSA
jgi:ABC-type nitrate/sulfonate/bicarbonate transport system ATPase subunit